MASLSARSFVEEGTFHVICFSKDRPFQAREFLRSVYAYLMEPGVGIKISMLYTFSNPQVYGTSYAKLVEQYQDVNFLKEEEGLFSSQLRDLVRTPAKFTVFAVDDIIFYKRFSMSLVEQAFSSISDLFVFHLKLDPNVCFCHPANAPAVQPRLLSPANNPLESTFLSFARGEGTEDWNYPWDLCFSTYRTTAVECVLDGIEKEFGGKGLSHPNRLEAYGNKLLKRAKSNEWYGMQCACPSVPVMSVLTVNRVQDIFANVTYGGQSALDMEMVFQKDPSLQLDFDRYCKTRFNSVHIGEVFFKQTSEEGSKKVNVTVSVLMCVYNGETFLKEAVDSILNQSFEELEFIIVNDGSTDGTRELLEDFAASDSRIVLLHNSINQGVACSLNRGLRHCSGLYIVRMDADDVSHSERVFYQLQAMEQFSEVDVVGTAVEIITDKSEAESLGKNRVIRHPMTPALIHWSMFFFCPLAHPTLMFRRSVFFESKDYQGTRSEKFHGYPEHESVRSVEDYSSWLDRMEGCVHPKELRALNLGHVLLSLRKHSKNVSKPAPKNKGKGATAYDQAVNTAVTYIKKRVESVWAPDFEVSPALVKTLRTPSLQEHVKDLISCAKLLLALEASFMKYTLGRFGMKTDDTSAEKTVTQDVTDRIGEMATLGMASYGSKAMPLWQLWIKRQKTPPTTSSFLSDEWISENAFFSAKANGDGFRKENAAEQASKDPMAAIMAFLG